MRRPFVFVCLLFAAFTVSIAYAGPPADKDCSRFEKAVQDWCGPKGNAKECVDAKADLACCRDICKCDGCWPEKDRACGRDPRCGRRSAMLGAQDAAPLDDSADRAKCIRDRTTCDSSMCSAVYAHPGDATPGEQRACASRQTPRCRQLLGEK